MKVGREEKEAMPRKQKGRRRRRRRKGIELRQDDLKVKVKG